MLKMYIRKAIFFQFQIPLRTLLFSINLTDFNIYHNGPFLYHPLIVFFVCQSFRHRSRKNEAKKMNESLHSIYACEEQQDGNLSATQCIYLKRKIRQVLYKYQQHISLY